MCIPLQLSIGQKCSSEHSASLDDIFIAAGGVSDGAGGKGAGDKQMVTVAGTGRRRTSEPNAPLPLKVVEEARQTRPTLDNLVEFEASPSGGIGRPYPVLGTSCSAEGIAQLVEGDWPDERCVCSLCIPACIAMAFIQEALPC